MSSLHALVTLAILLATACATSITFQNVSPHDMCYMVEVSVGKTFPPAATTTCGLGTGIALNAGQTTTVPIPSDFIGALTAWTNNNGVRGARYEVNFDTKDGTTWYDADYELGMSDGTIGPSDYRKLTDGRPSLAGEPDTLAKANAAWPDTTNKAELLQYPQYLTQGPDGNLTHVYCDKQAPQVVVNFFQVTAEFAAYVDAGSVAGVTPTPEEAPAVALANLNSLQVDVQDLTIVAH